MVRDAQYPKRRWSSNVTECNSALSHVVQPIRFKFLIIVFSQQRKVLRLWCQELPVKTFWKVVTLRGMVSTGLTQQPQGTPLECIVTWLLMEVSSNHSLPFKPVENRELVLHETGQRHDKEYVMSLFPASSHKAQHSVLNTIYWTSIGHPRYDQLTAVRKEHPLTREAWLYRVFRCKVSSFSPKATSNYNF